MTADLDTLLRQVARRDRDAFAAFYDATCARVYGTVLRVLRDPGYSEETTQEIYLQVWRTAESYDPASGTPLAWLLTVAHRRAVDRVRSEQAAGKRDFRYGTTSIERPADDVSDAVISGDERRRADPEQQQHASLERGLRVQRHQRFKSGNGRGHFECEPYVDGERGHVDGRRRD